MSEAKFTKGEWVADTPENLTRQGYLIVSFREVIDGELKYKVNGQNIRVYTSQYHSTTEKETIANANLIAAAPEMYAMLIKLQTEGGLGTARHKQIDKLLAKARGE